MLVFTLPLIDIIPSYSYHFMCYFDFSNILRSNIKWVRFGLRFWIRVRIIIRRRLFTHDT
jgi:hypothetical protein